MRHLKSGRKLNRTASHRKAMLSNLAVSLLDKERVTTTVAKAKEVRSVVERLITYGKKGTLHAIRLAARKINNKNVLKKLFEDIAPGYKDREGGYTRVVKLKNRKGDNAGMAIIELVGRHGDVQRKRKKKKKAPAQKAKTAVKIASEEAPKVTDEVRQDTVKEKKEAPKKKGAKDAAPKKMPAGAKKKKTEVKAEKKKETKAKKEAGSKEAKPKEAKEKKASELKKKKPEKE